MRARPRPMDGPGAGARHHHHLGAITRPGRPPPACSRTSSTHQYHRHSRPRGLHRRGGAQPARAGRRRGGVCAVGGSSPRARPSGARPTSTACRGWAFVNKMDRPGADFFRVCEMMRTRIKARPCRSRSPSGPRTLQGRGRPGHHAAITFNESDKGVEVFTARSPRTCWIPPTSGARR